MYPGLDVGEWDPRLAALWKWSNLRFIGFYLAHHATQRATTWTTHWHDLLDLGWKLIPFWVPFTGDSISEMKTTDGAAHGRAAVDRGHEAGLEAGTTIYLDVEAAVLGGDDDHAYVAYMINWMQTVHESGYSPGIYCSRLDAQRILTGSDFRPLRPSVWPFAIPGQTRAQWDDAAHRLTPATPQQWIVQTNDGLWVDNLDAVGCQYDWFNAKRDRKSIKWPNADGGADGSTEVDFDSAKVSDPAHPLASVAHAMVGDQDRSDVAYVFSASALELDRFERTASGSLGPRERFARSPADIGPDPQASLNGFDASAIAAVSRRPGFFDGFVSGQDGLIRQFRLNPQERFPSHTSSINPNTPARKGTPLIAISCSLDQVNVFYVGEKHDLTTQWWSPTDADWTRNSRAVGGPSVSGGSNLVALPSQHDAVAADRIDVFYTSADIGTSSISASCQVIHALRPQGEDWHILRVTSASDVASASGVAAVRDAKGTIHMVVQRRDRTALLHLIQDGDHEEWRTSADQPKGLPATDGLPDWWMCLHLVAFADVVLLFGMTRKGALARLTFGSSGWSEISLTPGMFSSGRPLAYARRGTSQVDIVGVTDDGVTVARTLTIGPDGSSSLNTPEPVRFAPIGVFDRLSEERPALLATEHRPAANRRLADRIGRIEIEFPNGVRVRADELVNEKALSGVIRALKGVV